MSEYLKTLNKLILTNAKSNGIVVLDLFAGCGGLALGFEANGFETIGYEMNEDACSTYKHNLNGICHNSFLSTDTEFPDADVVIGGPPCQPFSVGGNQKGLKDSRDGFPAFLHAIEQVKPKIWMFENVRGMMYRNKWYLDEVIAEARKLGYEISIKLFKASDYEVPQNRERLIVVGHKREFQFPTPIKKKFTAGDAVKDIAFNLDESTKFLTPNQDLYIAKYEKASKCINPRDLHFNRPARTVTCRNLAGATGDMHRIKLPDGRRKRLTVREGARLQSFPDWFEFKGTETAQFNQVGNAVPPLMSYHIANSISNYLNNVKQEIIIESGMQLSFL